MWWVVFLVVVVLYVHLFNAIAKLYLDSGKTMTMYDVYRRVIPPIDFHIRL